MAETNSTPCIYKAMAAIMTETKAVSKSQKNQQQGFMFRGIDSVMNELHSTFAKHGVFVIPCVAEYSVTEKITKSGSIMYYTRAKMEFHFTSSEDGSEIVVVNVGEAMDSGDKSMNKAMSIALKYALMQMLLIPTQEDKDPDATTPSDTRNMTIAEYAEVVSGNEELKSLLSELASAKSIDDIKDIYSQNVQYQASEYKKYFTARKNELKR